MDRREIMTIKEIVEYVLRTPHNTNRAILTGMLKQLIIDNGGSNPDDEKDDIIYDGGVEQ
jgi:hypothetical protein